jgi:hypothetical protein
MKKYAPTIPPSANTRSIGTVKRSAKELRNAAMNPPTRPTAQNFHE